MAKEKRILIYFDELVMTLAKQYRQTMDTHIYSPRDILSSIQGLKPVDAVEVVRCKYCAHARPKTHREQAMYNENVCICTKDDIWGIPKNEPVWGDSFCNDGERKDNG